MKLEQNHNFSSLPVASLGDIVHLKLVSVFDYLVKGIVSDTSEESISVTVKAIFDWQSHGQIVASEVNQFVGQTLSFEPKFLHNVIKKPQG